MGLISSSGTCDPPEGKQGPAVQQLPPAPKRDKAEGAGPLLPQGSGESHLHVGQEKAGRPSALGLPGAEHSYASVLFWCATMQLSHPRGETKAQLTADFEERRI